MKLTLIDKKEESSNVISHIFQLKLPLTWKAGQFLRYVIPDPNTDERRNYRFFTISSAPFEKNLMLTTKFVPDDGSTFKKDLKKLKVGDQIEASGPSGDFVVPDVFISEGKKLCFIAGGIGITPFRSIILDLDYKNQPLNITLLYANRTPDFIFKKELEEVQQRHPEFKIHYFIDPQRIDDSAINSALITYHLSLTANAGASLITFFISGPEPMVEAFEAMLYKMGILENQVKRDYFPGYEGM